MFKVGFAMQYETYKQMNEDDSLKEQYFLQRTNDLLEQIERLKAIDTSKDPRLQIDVSQAIERAYQTLDGLF